MLTWYVLYLNEKLFWDVAKVREAHCTHCTVRAESDLINLPPGKFPFVIYQNYTSSRDGPPLQVVELS